MQISRRVTNGLAWAGVALVVGIPAIDAVTGGPGEPRTAQVSLVSGPTQAVAPTPANRPQPAAEIPAQPAAVETAAAGNAVDSFVQSGRPLPAYISDAPAQSASASEPQRPAPAPTTPAAPAPTQTVAVPGMVVTAPTPPRTEQTATQAPIETAALSEQPSPTAQPARVAPTPAPLSMRPQPSTRPTQTAVTTSTQPSPAPGLVSTPGFNPQIVIPDTVVTGTVTPPPSGAIVPPASVPGGGDVLIGPADLNDWESGPLSDFLARRQGQSDGYISGDEWWAGADSGGSSATYQTWPPREVPQYRVYPLY
jgi:hypothetical protein